MQQLSRVNFRSVIQHWRKPEGWVVLEWAAKHPTGAVAFINFVIAAGLSSLLPPHRPYVLSHYRVTGNDDDSDWLACCCLVAAAAATHRSTDSAAWMTWRVEQPGQGHAVVKWDTSETRVGSTKVLAFGNFNLQHRWTNTRLLEKGTRVKLIKFELMCDTISCRSKGVNRNLRQRKW